MERRLGHRGFGNLRKEAAAARDLVDLAGELDGPVYELLRDIENFKQFSIVLHTLAWPNGADFAPEFLRERVAVTV